MAVTKTDTMLSRALVAIGLKKKTKIPVEGDVLTAEQVVSSDANVIAFTEAAVREWIVTSVQKVQKSVAGIQVTVTRYERDALDAVIREDHITIPFVAAQGRTRAEVLQDLFLAATRIWTAKQAGETSLASYLVFDELQNALNSWEVSQ